MRDGGLGGDSRYREIVVAGAIDADVTRLICYACILAIGYEKRKGEHSHTVRTQAQAVQTFGETVVVVQF